jgi:hypothetical protein
MKDDDVPDKQRTVQVAIRVPEDLLERIDEYAQRISEATPGLTLTRADAVRMLMTKALDAEDEATASAKTKKR